MSESTPIPYMTKDEYLKFELSSTIRHEYIQGQIFAMSGATEAHNVICGNLYVALHQFLDGSGCRAFMNDMKVDVEAANAVYYPDIMVTCEPFEANSLFKSSARLIVEVLSPSTKSIDRREKLVSYRMLPQLRQYLLVHQNRMYVEMYRLVETDHWEHVRLGLNDELVLEALPEKSLTIPVSEIYRNLILPSVVEEESEDYEYVPKYPGSAALRRVRI